MNEGQRIETGKPSQSESSADTLFLFLTFLWVEDDYYKTAFCVFLVNAVLESYGTA
jgi:hypothetical protein